MCAPVDVSRIDPRIGILIRGSRTVYYAYVNGYHRPPLEGSLKRVMAGLGLPSRERPKGASVMRAYVVTVTPRLLTHGSHGVNGAYEEEVTATSNSEAITKARQARRAEEGRFAVTADYKARRVQAD